MNSISKILQTIANLPLPKGEFLTYASVSDKGGSLHIRVSISKRDGYTKSMSFQLRKGDTPGTAMRPIEERLEFEWRLELSLGDKK